MTSIFDQPEIQSVLTHHSHNKILSLVAWALLSVMVIYVMTTQWDHPAQKDLIPYEIIVSLICWYNFDLDQQIIHRVEILKAKESKGIPAQKLADKFKSFYHETITHKSWAALAFFLLIGLSTPPMLKEAIEGKLPWKDVGEYMLYLAFMGTISLMVIMSMNFPFIIHTMSYTLSGVFLLVIYLHESKLRKKVDNWSKTSLI